MLRKIKDSKLKKIWWKRIWNGKLTRILSLHRKEKILMESLNNMLELAELELSRMVTNPFSNRKANSMLVRVEIIL